MSEEVNRSDSHTRLLSTSPKDFGRKSPLVSGRKTIFSPVHNNNGTMSADSSPSISSRKSILSASNRNNVARFTALSPARKTLSSIEAPVINSAFTDALNQMNNSTISNFNMEEVRTRVKKWVTNSFPGLIYNNTMLIISMFSPIEYIYVTYLDTQDAAQDMILQNLYVVEKVLACFFMFDWCLNFFIADHKVIFMTRFFHLNIIVIYYHLLLLLASF